MRITPTIRACCFFHLALVSCQSSQSVPVETPAITDTRPGLILFIPGITNRPGEFRWTTRGLRDAGIDDEFEILRWDHASINPLRNLTDLDANRRRASVIANRIADIHAKGAYGRISLVAASGGAGLALMAVEQLQSDAMLDRLVLMAAAVSCNYDLSIVLSHCRNGLVNFYSPNDLIVSLGTVAFGTMDRSHVISAGHRGFHLSDPSQDAVVRQIVWKPSWRQWGHEGGHIGYRSRGWASEILAPMLTMPIAPVGG